MVTYLYRILMIKKERMFFLKVLVVGANGQIGKHLTRYIQASDRMMTKAMIRKQEQAEFFEELGAETVLVDLEESVEKISEAAQGVDAVVFKIGRAQSELQSRGHLVC